VCRKGRTEEKKKNIPIIMERNILKKEGAHWEKRGDKTRLKACRENPPQKKKRPERSWSREAIREGGVSGVQTGGNKVGQKTLRFPGKEYIRKRKGKF